MLLGVHFDNLLGPLSPVKTNQCNRLGFCCSFKREDECGSTDSQRPSFWRRQTPGTAQGFQARFCGKALVMVCGRTSVLLSHLHSLHTHSHRLSISPACRLISIIETKTERGEGWPKAQHPTQLTIDSRISVFMAACLKPQGEGQECCLHALALSLLMLSQCYQGARSETPEGQKPPSLQQGSL